MRVFVVSMLLVFGFPFIMTDVVDSFKTCKQFFFKDNPPVIPGILEKSVSKNQNRFKIICQKYNSIYRFATFYDTTNKIPLFSAYKFTENKKFKLSKRPPWMTEPQVGLQLPNFFLPVMFEKNSLLCLSLCQLSVL